MRSKKANFREVGTRYFWWKFGKVRKSVFLQLLRLYNFVKFMFISCWQLLQKSKSKCGKNRTILGFLRRLNFPLILVLSVSWQPVCHTIRQMFVCLYVCFTAVRTNQHLPDCIVVIPNIYTHTHSRHFQFLPSHYFPHKLTSSLATSLKRKKLQTK